MARERPDAKNLLTEAYKSKLLELYEDVRKRLEERLGEYSLSIGTKLADAAGSVVFDASRAQQLMDMVVGIDNVIDVDAAALKFINDVDSLVKGVSAEPQTTKKDKKRQILPGFQDIYDALDMLVDEPGFKENGISIGDVMQVLGMAPKLAGPLAMTLKRRGEEIKQHGYEYREVEKRWYPTTTFEEQHEAKLIQPEQLIQRRVVALTPTTTETGVKYTFPENLPSTEKLESSGILNKLYREGKVKVDDNFTYGNDGSLRGRAALKYVKKDVIRFMRGAGYQGKPEIRVESNGYTLKLFSDTRKEFRNIVDSKTKG
ncbi:MAG TPA: hypothetical protein VJB05_03985 [archaeon]|nr:hypothetical protein [archaeon]